MPASTNEWEFQGEALSWFKDELTRRKMGWDNATQEFPNAEGRRSDIIVWRNHATQDAVLELELKTPATPLSDLTFQRDATRKAQAVGAPYFALWNMRRCELWKTPAAPRKDVLDTDFVTEVEEVSSVTKVEDWKTASVAKELHAVVGKLLLLVHDLSTRGTIGGQVVDATVFVDSLADHIGRLRASLLLDFHQQLGAKKKLRQTIVEWATKQGLADFAEDLYESLAAQLAYRIVGQVLFYYSFRRQEPSLPSLKLKKTKPVREQLRTHWDAVRAYDYEALYAPSPLEDVPLNDYSEKEILGLVSSLDSFDWDSVDDDVLGSIFEQMIPEPERIVLGQYYTPPRLADVIVSLCMDSPEDIVLDPAVGTGTFLYRAYSRIRSVSKRSHADTLTQLWGVDISAFPAELSVINLCRLDLAEQSNFPRVTVRDFFELEKDATLSFPPAKRVQGSSEQIPTALPTFDCVIGNPPYVRSQQLDDLDPSYKTRLETLATYAGVTDTAKFDAFAYFIVHAAAFLSPGGRLGFVTSAAWLTTKYGAALQRFLLENFRDVSILWSEAEPFFAAQEVNTIVVLARRVAEADESRGEVRFVTLEQPLEVSLPSPTDGLYWQSVDGLTDAWATAAPGLYKGYRITVLDGDEQLKALREHPKEFRNWAVPLRARSVYSALFGVDHGQEAE